MFWCMPFVLVGCDQTIKGTIRVGTLCPAAFTATSRMCTCNFDRVCAQQIRVHIRIGRILLQKPENYAHVLMCRVVLHAFVVVEDIYDGFSINERNAQDFIICYVCLQMVGWADPPTIIAGGVCAVRHTLCSSTTGSHTH